MPFTLATTPFNYDDAGFVSPADNGRIYTPIPANSYVELTLLLTVAFDQPGEIDAYLSTSPTDPAIQLGDYRADTAGAPNAAGYPQMAYGNATTNQYSINSINTTRALLDSFIILGFYPSASPPTQGAGLIVAKIYS